jgi:hypothetical protein
VEVVFRGEGVCKQTLKRTRQARCQWLTPVILTTWEAEIRRIVV